MPKRSLRQRHPRARRPDIDRVEQVRYGDTGQRMTHVHWSDGSTTSGDPKNAHIRELVKRAKREHRPIRRIRT